MKYLSVASLAFSALFVTPVFSDQAIQKDDARQTTLNAPDVEKSWRDKLEIPGSSIRAFRRDTKPNNCVVFAREVSVPLRPKIGDSTILYPYRCVRADAAWDCGYGGSRPTYVPSPQADYSGVVTMNYEVKEGFLTFFNFGNPNQREDSQCGNDLIKNIQNLTPIRVRTSE